MLQRAARTLSLDKVLYCDGLSFGIIRHSRQVQMPFVHASDALIIQTVSDKELEEICRELRSQAFPEDYLKPILMVANPMLMPSWKNEVDGIADMDNLNLAAERARQIHKQIARIASIENPPQTQEIEILIKVLQFLFTRQKELTPFPNRYSKVHYQFPFVSHFYDSHEEHKVLHILSLAEKQGWLTGRTLDKIHTCPNCQSAHQNLRATCPKCKSVDLLEEDLVHHFQCAHIAPMSDFERDGMDGLHCPKCDKSLRHIGNDYDKPSSIYNCNSCHHPFQQSNYQSLCIDCGTEHELNSLNEDSIRINQLTGKGKSIVLNGTGFGMVNEPKPKMPVHTGIYEFDVFKLMLRQELTRRKTNPRPGVLGKLKIDGIIVDNMPPQTKQELIIEVCQVIKSYLKEPDVVSAKGAGAYYFMMTENGLAEAKYLNEVLTYNLEKLIGSNFKGGHIKVQLQLESMLGK